MHWWSKKAGCPYSCLFPFPLHPPPPLLPIPSVAKDWAGDQEVGLELSVCSLACCWDGREKQMTLYLCPCRKRHPGLRLRVRQHAEQKCVCPRPLCDNEDGYWLVNSPLRTSLCHHPQGNMLILVVSLLVLQPGLGTLLYIRLPFRAARLGKKS